VPEVRQVSGGGAAFTNPIFMYIVWYEQPHVDCGLFFEANAAFHGENPKKQAS
jgi:hypothetical protein